MTGDLGIVREKLAHAEAHAREFESLWKEFVHSGAYGYTSYLDRRTPEDSPNSLHCKWQINREPGPEFALIQGDFLSNLRASLDYLVWQLVLAAENTPTYRNAFPRVRGESDWGRARGDRLAGVDERWANEIKELQPYNRTDRPERHLLAVLDHVNNINKHRVLQTTVATAMSWSPVIHAQGGQGYRIEHWLDVPIEDGLEFFRITFDPPVNELPFGPDTNPPLRISFSDGLDHSDGWNTPTPT